MSKRLGSILLCLGFLGCIRPDVENDTHTDTGFDTDSTVEDTGIPTEDPLRTVDVLIIGAGVAGLAAGDLLEDAGLDYLLVDLDSQLGGTAIYSGGLMTFSGTSLQDAIGVEDSAELLLSEWADMTDGDPADPWVETYANRNTEVHDYLSSRGVRFALNPLPADGASVRRIHMVDGGGGALIGALRSGIDESRVWLQTECLELVVDPTGRVLGAWVEREVGTGWVAADNTLVATGGFLRNLEQVETARSDLDTDNLWFSTGPNANGSGHRMLEDAGAVWENRSTLSLYAHGIADPRSDGEELLLLGDKPLAMFNRSGSRFTSESPESTYSQGNDLVAQDGQLGWFLFDSSTSNRLVIADPMILENELAVPSLDTFEDTGQLASSDTLEELAREIGMDATGLGDSVEELNRIISEGLEDPFWGEVPEMDPIETAPFYAIRVVPALAKAFGGISVDTEGRVIDGTGGTIPGLFAAGELTGMAGGSLVGEGQFTGSLSAVLLSGWVVAETLIEERETTEPQLPQPLAASQ